MYDGLSPSEQAWQLINTCPWQLHTSEKFVLVCLGRAMEQQSVDSARQWVPPLSVSLVWKCSEANAKEFLKRPRVAGAVETTQAEGKDGKFRTYYRLAEEWDENKGGLDRGKS
jgi:hypothetical protein